MFYCVFQVLTSRIAYMILQHSIPPSSICAVTFTNKAANEMRERLKKLIGPGRTELLKMGTFHALCARFLRIHSTLVGLDANFTICDADERCASLLTELQYNKSRAMAAGKFYRQSSRNTRTTWKKKELRSLIMAFSL